ncbi:uncharacterized protein SPSC_04616 [Sporisorium scitamineum]|uniref:Uncharacterized protein n=2 Tax=Sporisorium scitamineum TaxID=49012 RepID=A0A127ZH49_9BASI|nr:uncharacterized protein SPSC_04616 [Sporisorium scitamineum]
MPVEPIILQATINKDCTWTSLLELISSVDQSAKPSQTQSKPLVRLSTASTDAVDQNQHNAVPSAVNASLDCISPADTASFNEATGTSSSHNLTRSYSYPFDTHTNLTPKQEADAVGDDRQSAVDLYCDPSNWAYMAVSPRSILRQASPPPMSPSSSTAAPAGFTGLPVFPLPHCDSSVGSLKRKERDEQLSHTVTGLFNSSSSSSTSALLDMSNAVSMSSPMWADLHNMWCNSLISFLDSPSVPSVSSCSTSATPSDPINTLAAQCPASPIDHNLRQQVTTTPSASINSVGPPTVSPLSQFSLHNPASCSSSSSTSSASWGRPRSYTSSQASSRTRRSRSDSEMERCNPRDVYHAARVVHRLFPLLPPLEILARMELRRFRPLPDHLLMTVLAIGHTYATGGVTGTDSSDAMAKRSSCNEAVQRLERKIHASESSASSSSCAAQSEAATVDQAVTLLLFTRFCHLPLQKQWHQARRESLALCFKKLCRRLVSCSSELSPAELRTVKLLHIEATLGELVSLLGARDSVLEDLGDRIEHLDLGSIDYPPFEASEFSVAEPHGGIVDPLHLGQDLDTDARSDAEHLAQSANLRLELVRVAVKVFHSLAQLQQLQLSTTTHTAAEVVADGTQNKFECIRQTLSECTSRVESNQPENNCIHSNELFSLVKALISLANATLDSYRYQARRASCEADLLRRLCSFTTPTALSALDFRI